jgi:S1-C subfamily serine protease
MPIETHMDFESLQANALNGDAESQFNLAKMYDEGGGRVSKSSEEAVKWYRKSAEQGFVAAQLILGMIYDSGKGVIKDYEEAAKWYRKAAEQNILAAQFILGGMYAEGKGVPKSSREAVKWLRLAVEDADTDALATMGRGVFPYLGSMFEIGDGVPRNYVEAYKWYSLWAAQGNDEARAILHELESQMTAHQVSDAQRLAFEYHARRDLDSNKFIVSQNKSASGTGFFITDDGYLISNYHVVKAAAKVRLVTSAGTVDAKVVQVDAANDLALLKADGKFSPLPISPSRSAQMGGTVATIGFPDPSLQGFSPKLAKGEIASLSGAGDDPRYFQISVPVQPGNSGGALVDERGNVIGIVSAKLDASTALAMSGSLPENVNYAVKSSLLLSFLESVPDVDAKLKAPNTVDEKFEEVVKSAQDAAVLVLVY